MCGPKIRSPKSQNVIHVPGECDTNINVTRNTEAFKNILVCEQTQCTKLSIMQSLPPCKNGLYKKTPS